ncbi:MAG: DnaD domain protein [Eubacteriales bacterium]|nr:DnaD domain protein [Eubacteriales bacterium]
MDYKSEVSAFNGQLEAGTMNACEIALWHALHDVSILCGHSDELSVATVTLAVRTGFSASSIKRARDSMRDRGYLTYYSRGSNRSAVYSLRSVAHREPQREPRDEPQDEPQREPRDGPIYTTTTKKEVVGNKSAHREPQDEPQGEPQGELHGVKPWMDDEEADRIVGALNGVLDEAQRIGMPQAQSDYEKANALVAEYGAEWATEALYRAGLREAKARNWRFVEGILRSWKQKGGIDPREKPPEAAPATKVKFADLR